MRGRCGTRTTLALRGELQLRTADGGASGHVESDGGHCFCRHRTMAARGARAERFIGSDDDVVLAPTGEMESRPSCIFRHPPFHHSTQKFQGNANNQTNSVA